MNETIHDRILAELSHTPIDLLFVAIENGRWGPARLVRPLDDSGFRVSALAPSDNALAHAGRLHRRFLLDDASSSRRFARALASAMDAVRPRIVVPADERTVAMLHALVAGGSLDGEHAATILSSLGDPDHYADALLKDRTMALAHSFGVRVPKSVLVADAAEAIAAARRIGFPVYLKRSFGWAGEGSQYCGDEETLAATLADWLRPQSFPALRTLARRALGRDWYPDVRRIQVQKAIDGRPAMVCAAALDGVMLAGFSAQTLRTAYEGGPSSAVRIGVDAALLDAAADMIGALGASGFIGFDFMIEAESGNAYLIECNPRPIQIGHLGARIGVDICRALAEALGGPRFADGEMVLGEAEVDLFPQEWMRLGADPELLGRFDDAPSSDPKLLSFMTRGAKAPRGADPARRLQVA